MPAYGTKYGALSPSIHLMDDNENGFLYIQKKMRNGVILLNE